MGVKHIYFKRVKITFDSFIGCNVSRESTADKRDRSVFVDFLDSANSKK